MATPEKINNWDIIQSGVSDTERLIGQKQYNMSMIKARQTLEYMVNLLGDKACIAHSDLIDVIDALYQGKWITKSTCERYNKIRIIGNKAVHEGNNNAYDANQAYHLLSQEVYIFANEYNRKRNVPGRPSGTGSRQRTGSTHSSQRVPSQTSQKGRSASRKRKGAVASYDLLMLLVPILSVILLIGLIKLIRPGDGDAQNMTNTTPIANEIADMPTETIPQPTETQVQAQATVQETLPPEPDPIITKTTTRVRVRPEPNKENTELAILEADTIVDVIGSYDDEWTIINHENREAYIYSQFLSSE